MRTETRPCLAKSPMLNMTPPGVRPNTVSGSISTRACLLDLGRADGCSRGWQRGRGPYHVQVPTDVLGRLAGALDVVDQYAELNHRYRKLIRDSREVLGAERIRLTQARGVAQRLLGP